MNNNLIFVLVRFVLFGSIFMFAYGVWTISYDNFWPALMTIGVSVVCGLLSAPFYFMYKDNRFNKKPYNQIVRETLNKLSGRS